MPPLCVGKNTLLGCMKAPLGECSDLNHFLNNHSLLLSCTVSCKHIHRLGLMANISRSLGKTIKSLILKLIKGHMTTMVLYNYSMKRLFMSL